MAILRNDTTIRSADGQSTSPIITAANIGNYGISTTSTYYIGTTQNVFNRASGAQTLTGVSIDGNAATVTNGLTTTNYSSYALPISGGTMTGVLQSNKPINASGATYGSQATYVGNWSGTGWWGLGSESGHILKFDQVAYADVNSPTWIGATDLVLKLGTKFVRDSYYRTISGIGDYYASGASGWYTVASITLTTNCTGGVLYGTLYDHRYDGADAYQISIVARAECDFQTNNESHYVNVGCTILGSTNITNYQSKIRVLLVASSANSRTYEVQFLETAWNRDTWQLETSGSPVWTIYSTAQAPGTSTGTARVFYISNNNADNIRANTASYSPVYYDSANTAYYIDPASTSIVNSFKVYDALYFGDYTTYLSQATPYLRITTANGYGNFGPANSSWFHMTTDRPNFYMAVGLHINGDLFIYNTQSQLTSTSVRAPIFYDSGDTTYYLDPANTGTSLLVAGKVGIGITSPLLKLQVDAAPGNPATTGTTQNGIFRISNSTDNAVLDFGMRAAGAGAWLQSTDETSLAANYPLLLNPNGANVGINNLSADTNLQVVGHVHVGNQTTFENTGGWNKTIYLDGTIHARMRILGSAYASGKNSATETSIWVDNSVAPYSGLTTNAGSFTINAGFTTLTNSVRSPIFYDSDDTNYYCDPNSVSRLSSLRVYSAFDTASSDVYANMRVMRNNATTDGMYIGYGNSGSTAALTRIFGGGATTGELSKYSTYTLEPGSFRSPIFYDSDNTSYYIDAASTSVINAISIAGNSTFSTDSYLTFGPNSTWGSSIRIGGNGYTATGTEMASVVTTDGNLHLDAAKSTNGIYLNWYGGTSGVFFGNGSAGQAAFVSSSGNAVFNGVVDATQFRDASNTAYYADPASTSNLYALTVNDTLTYGVVAAKSFSVSINTSTYWTVVRPNGSSIATGYVYRITLCTTGTGTDTGEQYLLANVDSAGWVIKTVTKTGSGSNWPYVFLDAGVPKVKTDHASLYTVTVLVEELNSGNTGGLPSVFGLAGLFTSDNGTPKYRAGWFSSDNTLLHSGNYSGYSTFSGIVSSAVGGFQTATYAAGRNRIWSFGNSDGYGLSYFQGSGGISGSDVIGLHFGTATAVGSQFQFLANGSLRVSGDVRAPIFYDSDNTAYYIDAAGTSNLVGLTVANTITGSISGNAATATNATQLGGVAAANYVRNDVDGSNSTALFRLTTITKSLTITTSWLDTGIVGADLSTGCYMISVYVDNYAVNGGHYQETYTGMMSWFSTGTNSTDYDEIVLHKSGHASNGAYINLRTIRQVSGGTNLKLQIISSVSTNGASNYVFKFRRLI